MFPENDLFPYVLIELAEALVTFPIEAPRPLRCDRWIARSALQKAVRRGEAGLAQRALANLYEHDPATVWRHLIIICIEDVGVANVDLLAQIIAAKRDRPWRGQKGGDWHVLSGLVRLMAESTHCQAACDLLLRVMNDPALELAKANALEAEVSTLANQIAAPALPIEHRAIAAMAMGGCLADGQSIKDPCGVFDIMAELGHFSHVVATCRAAWKISRNPMALLLPFVWQAWMQDNSHRIEDDILPPVQLIGDVPGYALDQFTRTGNQISRAYLAEDQALRRLFEEVGIPKGDYVRTLGDLLFLIEGGLVGKRMIWAEGERLRLPYRSLPSVAKLRPNLPATLRHCQDKARQIGTVRRRVYHSTNKDDSL